MAHIILPHRWQQQPQYPVEINKSHPLGAALDFVWNGGAKTVRDASGRLSPTPAANTVWTPKPQGVAIANTGTAGSSTTLAEITKIKAYPYILFGYGYFNSAIDNWRLSPYFTHSAGGYVGGIRLNSTTAVDLRLQYNYGTTRTISVTTGTGSSSGLSILAIAQVFSETDYRLYANGSQTNGTLSPGVLGSFDQITSIGGNLNGGIWASGYGLGKSISDEYAKYITGNHKEIWQIFRPQQRRIWVPVSAGGVSGTLVYTNSDDTLSAAGTTTVTGTLATTNANDTISAAGTTTVVGTLVYTNANDTISASGAVGSDITGTVNYTNANDTLSAAGTTTVTGTVAYTNANDTLSGAGSPIIVGDLAYTNANDTLSASGAAGTVTGTLDYTNANDTLSASGQVEGSDAEIAGAGYPVYQVKQRKKQKPHVRIDDVIERSMRELYEGVIDTAPQQIKKQAAKLVRPYIEKGTKPATVPPPSAINWIALERDAARVSALLALWQEQMESLEDEEMLLMLMAA